jgi:hypothetical protein
MVKLNGTTTLNQDKTPLEKNDNGNKPNMHFVAIQIVEKLEEHH